MNKINIIYKDRKDSIILTNDQYHLFLRATRNNNPWFIFDDKYNNIAKAINLNYVLYWEVVMYWD